MRDRPLIVGVDGSDQSLTALDWAVDEAARHGVELRILHASVWERYEGIRPSFATDRPAEQVMAENVVASCTERARLRDPHVKISADVLPEDPVTALVHAGHDAFAIVTGSRGRGGVPGLLLGSVSLAVAGRSMCPVFVVRGENTRGGTGRLVLGAHDVGEDTAAVRFAFREAEVRGCVLHAVHAWRYPLHRGPAHPLLTEEATAAYEEGASHTLSQVLSTAEADHPDVEVRRRLMEGAPHKVLVHASADADLVVLGALRRHGHFGLQLGRTGHALLHHSACPVAVVPHRI
ncbi:universal stress protein [Streptomyces sp. NPDC018031]|uniref:universal stress protein n=1 Tax=Streptomyces sp. NPDC018031 TaxID=3365033 RepID=UPI0037BA351A